MERTEAELTVTRTLRRAWEQASPRDGLVRWPWTHAEIGAARSTEIERVLAAITLVTLGAQRTLTLGATLGVAVSLLFAPMWLRVLLRFHWARLYLAVGGLAVAWGLVLNRLAVADHVTLRHSYYATTFLLLEVVCGVGVVLWAATLMSVRALGCCFALGLVVNAILSPGPLAASNPLKYAWMIPLATLVFSLVDNRRALRLQLLAVLALGALAITADLRSFVGTALITVVLIAWQLRPRVQGIRSSWAWTLAFLLALGFAIYNLVTVLLINGYLGSDAQMRSIRQVEESGSLLLGGRPELSATWTLLRHFPGGFGPGVVANLHEVNVAKTGMASINYDPDNGYVDRFMFGSAVELHSTFGDLWAAFGYAGILLCLMITLLVLGTVAKLVAARRATALVLFFSTWTMWNLLFSPLLSAAPTLLFTVGLLILQHPASGPRLPASDTGLVSLGPRVDGKALSAPILGDALGLSFSSNARRRVASPRSSSPLPRPTSSPSTVQMVGRATPVPEV
jgi:hypothetical protein